MPTEQIHFVTGRLAEQSLRSLLDELAPRVGFTYTIDVLPITVAALMTPDWIARRIHVPAGTARVITPGYCDGDLAPIVAAAGAPVERGPRDLRRLPEFFGQRPAVVDYGRYDIEILAEINHAPRLSLESILVEAARLKSAGADLIDIGCDPGEPWSGVTDAVRALRDAGYRVSIDSMNPREIEPAVRAGAELVLSVNSANCRAALDWGCEVVIVPDSPSDLSGLDETVNRLAEAKVPLRIDPVLEPIGFGFAASLHRYIATRKKYPDAEMMMGVGNLTELTEVDSAGVNMLLLSICEELGVRSVLTTEVIHWAASSVAECDIARRLAHYAVSQRQLPKHVDSRLVMLRGGRPLPLSADELDRLAAALKDNNYRIFADGGQVHLVAAGLHLADADPFSLFARLQATGAKNLDAGHAFYLGYEMAKALTALTLGKEYRQDEALDWGLLTRPENRHRL